MIVSWEGRRVAELFVNGEAQIKFAAGVQQEDANMPIDLRIETPDAWQPRALGLSGDYRRFALLLDSIEIRADETELQASSKP